MLNTMPTIIAIDLNASNPKQPRCYQPKQPLYIYLVIALLLALFLFICKTYLRSTLLWLEIQPVPVITLALALLYTVAALPIAVGYIVIVLASGYLFGFASGLAFTVVGANVGLAIAHTLLRCMVHGRLKGAMGQGEGGMVQMLLRLIGGHLAFRIVVCARLTPIPFGVQNTIFAMSDVNRKIYHVASLLGLLPAQCVAVYMGSTLRSMQDVIENRTISTGTYVFAVAQVILAISLLIWIGNKARKEIINLDKANINNSYRIV